MKITNPKKIRAELKDHLNLAANEPIRIQRRPGDSFVLLNEALYANMQNEIISLQRRLLGMTDTRNGRVTEYKIGDKSRLKRFQKAD